MPPNHGRRVKGATVFAATALAATTTRWGPARRHRAPARTDSMPDRWMELATAPGSRQVPTAPSPWNRRCSVAAFSPQGEPLGVFAAVAFRFQCRRKGQTEKATEQRVCICRTVPVFRPDARALEATNCIADSEQRSLQDASPTAENPQSRHRREVLLGQCITKSVSQDLQSLFESLHPRILSHARERMKGWS